MEEAGRRMGLLRDFLVAGLLEAPISSAAAAQWVRIHHKEPVRLELLMPHEEGYEFKAVVTNKVGSPKAILLFHSGRGAQENVFAELKSQCQMDYVPTHRLSGNQVYFLSAVLAHNLYRELQMGARAADRGTMGRCLALWIFAEAATIR